MMVSFLNVLFIDERHSTIDNPDSWGENLVINGRDHNQRSRHQQDEVVYDLDWYYWRYHAWPTGSA